MSIMPGVAGLLLTFFLVAFFGGGVRAALRGPSTPFRTVAVYSAACGFTGFVVGLLCLYMMGDRQPYLSLLFVALAGWVGPDLVEQILAVVSARAGVKLPPETPLPAAPKPDPQVIQVHVYNGTTPLTPQPTPIHDAVPAQPPLASAGAKELT